MHPELFTLPVFGITVKTYGFCLMVGFLSAVWLAMRRAERVKADPDCVLDLSFLALVFGVGGARVFYVVHYWKTQFADVRNPLLAAIDIRQGGLEFLGGVLGALLAIVFYLVVVKKKSVRLYLDILAPGLMWGLAFGRIGCFFNGCCFGGPCDVLPTAEPQYSWAVQFPYGSPAHQHAWENREVTVPAELVQSRGARSYLLWPGTLSLSVERREGPRRQAEELQKALAEANAEDPKGQRATELTEALKAAKARRDRLAKQHHLDELKWAQKFPSRHDRARNTSVSELQQMAAECVSPYVHPTQLYSAINAMILAGFLSILFHLRKRHGIVIGLFFVLYPLGRFLIETIRNDNPHDTFGLTIAQSVSIALFVGGVLYLYVVYKFLPKRSPRLA
ncbi:MAG: prolipoprotein diacylglyceryl transferase [Phycisphaerales bacterium]|nr:MAG: prolipoprotein diacylglyceryl transferase [Phycisphaerales bacterium]